MKKQRILYSGLILLTVCCALGFFLRTAVPNHQFEKFTDSVFCNEVVSDTLTLHYTIANPASYGIKDYPVTFGEFPQISKISDEDISSGMASENYSQILTTFDKNKLSHENQLTYDILKYCLDKRKEGLPFYLYPEILSPGQGIQSQLPIVLAEYEFRNKTDISNYLDLLSQMDTYFDAAIKYEQERAENGVSLADFAIRTDIEQCDQFLNNQDNHYMITTFQTRLDGLSSLTQEEKQAFIQQNNTVLKDHVFPAYKNLKEALEGMEAAAPDNMALCRLPQGKEYYQYLVQSITGSSKTIPEIKKRMQSEFSTDFVAYSDLINDYTTLEASLSDDLFGDSPDLMLKDLKKKIGTDFPELKESNYSIKYVDDSLQDFMSPAFYMTPAIDDNKKNVIYINPASSYSSLNLYTTLAHEGYPGHLYQTLYFNQQNPSPIRNILSFGGYTEGWALYVEMYSYDLAEEDPAFCEIQRLNHAIQLCLFSFMDIGIHYDGLMKADVFDNLSRYGINDPDSQEQIYEYISEEPGNYLKYYLGYLEFMDLRKDAETALGDKFDLKSFHKFLLDNGPCPFSIISQQEQKWINQNN